MLNVYIIMRFNSYVYPVLLAGFSNFISTIFVILLYGDPSKNWFLLNQSFLATFIMVLNMNMSKILKSCLLDKKWEDDNLTRNRLKLYIENIEKALGSNLLIGLNVSILFQSTLLLIQSNQRINLTTLVAMVVHYSI